MNKIAKLFVTFFSAITLALVSFTSSFAKEDEKDTNAKVIAEKNVTNSFAILFIISPC